jgi:hypothetical protein
MVYFQTKNPDLCKFGKVLQWKMLAFVMVSLSLLRPNGTFYGHLVHFVIIYPVLVYCNKINLATLNLSVGNVPFCNVPISRQNIVMPKK